MLLIEILRAFDRKIYSSYSLVESYLYIYYYLIRNNDRIYRNEGLIDLMLG